jgi:hypothetical protein
MAVQHAVVGSRNGVGVALPVTMLTRGTSALLTRSSSPLRGARTRARGTRHEANRRLRPGPCLGKGQDRQRLNTS